MRVVSCVHCGTDFVATSPRHSLCSEECRKERQKVSLNKAAKKWRNNPKNLATMSKRNKKYRRDNLSKSRIWMLRAKARKIGVCFDLDEQWLAENTPEFCPILGIKLDQGDRNSTASVDRINPRGGYVKENCRVISLKANTLKNDASPEELKKILDYIESNTNQ